jgi:O-antigen ligase
MKRLFTDYPDSFADRVSYWHLVVLLATLPFDMLYSHLVLISFCLHTLIHLNLKSEGPVYKRRICLLSSIFLLTVVSTLYSINLPEAFNQWGRQSTMLIIPVVFSLNPLRLKTHRYSCFMLFALVCTCTIIYLYADALITIRHYGLPYRALWSAAFTNHNFSQPLAIHATFFSMQIGLALIFLITDVIATKNFFRKGLLGLCAAILSAGLLQLGSKSVVISLILIINLVIPVMLLTGISRRRFLTASIVLSFMLFILICSQANLKNRYVDELWADFTLKPQHSTLDSRASRWRVAVSVIGESPLAGHGAGSEITLLQDGFYKNKLYNSYLNRLNAHSEYLSLLIKTGAIGLMVYLCTLIYGFVMAVRAKDPLFVSFLLIVACVSCSENLLDVDKGIIFYALFFSLFIFMNGKSNRKKKAWIIRVENPRQERAIVHG